ncbi:peptide chain release factor N(5)-glutamine methyltransferase [Actinobacillus suis]|uniref:Release factor glutamine methyltransferase n=2 Tax=Actinobacillus suis TaxID=716 RepID=K0G7M1_ACTSU|nr:peptide chain release factor N(5)-glutamine methyltransferase [Actinobacillus suis]AFU20391.1 N5-glutamine S-adenosyl-L-methionine-dependent methyltransferase [Actinobacillus suis H91-0380]AIJ32522.1 N5-glutamine S-adenosyl-L-methionine-dependent methyltransferase [Actinobacillus suis ATCC 33415]MCO4167555.1 peptide chain release factor N(5)-glutamine methyltransferase [Actinobacillus suis]MCO4170047.1 peptide chain release factor N(5)-glutamine methyltransferase [Actinobacillus suis]MCQ963
MTYTEWLAYAVNALQANLAQDPYLHPKTDANILLQAVTKRSKSAIFAFGETELSQTEISQLEALLTRRLQGEPMAYILGEKEFWSLPLKVSPHTLIPRPDTERLVEIALDWAYKRLKTQQTLQILDLGTGTGAIALALASELGDKAQILGVDFKAEAVALAETNRQNLGFNNVSFLQSDWFSALENQQFDLIVSNPPYIDKQDENLKYGDVRFEPLSALVAEEDGLSDLQKIIQNAPLYLYDNGALMLEHGWQQAQAVQQIFKQYQWDEVASFQDYGGNDRLTKAVRKAK